MLPVVQPEEQVSVEPAVVLAVLQQVQVSVLLEVVPEVQVI